MQFPPPSHRAPATSTSTSSTSIQHHAGALLPRMKYGILLASDEILFGDQSKSLVGDKYNAVDVTPQLREAVSAWSLADTLRWWLATCELHLA